MSKPRILILRAPGTNCDAETAYAFQCAGGLPEVVHLNRWLESPQLAANFQILCIPGGFSYGDDVAAGRIFANKIRHHLSDVMREFCDAGKLVLGICNGFQVLIKSGILDTDDGQGPTASLTWNDSGCYVARWVHLRKTNDKCVFLAGIEDAFLPIAHAEGKFVTRDAESFAQLESAEQLVLRYCPQPENGCRIAEPYNPNGAVGDVAGMCDKTGRVLGLMPHPERFIDPTQHPQWTRMPERPAGGGLHVFRNGVRYFS
ncbi:MAG: phosphoribosylformylglycinamidine synthase I [Pirellulales bacterium]|nr:phosphoribosylformylglycinamidine synthase I [Pirellulales bacterium]